MAFLNFGKNVKLTGVPENDIFLAIRHKNPLLLINIMNTMQNLRQDWTRCRQEKSLRTPLHACAKAGNVDIMRILCQDRNFRTLYLELTDVHGKTCLHEAAVACSAAMVNYIIHQGARIDSLKIGDWTPLMLACNKVGDSAFETIKVLLENGANISLKNKDNWSPLHIAVRKGDTNIISLLLSHNADVSAVTRTGRSVLHIAAMNSRVNALELLLNHGHLTVDCKDSSGITPFLYAGIKGSVEIARLLISKGACSTEVDTMGLSGIHLAAKSGHAAMVKYLVDECGMNVNLQTEGSAVTPLHSATRAGQVSTVKMLLELGANPNLFAKDGWADSRSHMLKKRNSRIRMRK